MGKGLLVAPWYLSWTLGRIDFKMEAPTQYSRRRTELKELLKHSLWLMLNASQTDNECVQVTSIISRSWLHGKACYASMPCSQVDMLGLYRKTPMSSQVAATVNNNNNGSQPCCHPLELEWGKWRPCEHNGRAGSIQQETEDATFVAERNIGMVHHSGSSRKTPQNGQIRSAFHDRGLMAGRWETTDVLSLSLKWGFSLIS